MIENKNYLTTIGIEIHLELNTKSKMFSDAPIQKNAPPNSAINEIDLGYPGTLPTVNQEGVKKGIILAKALKMEISPILKFDRKNYFYPDLPKGYQITQDRFPLGKNGQLFLFNQKMVEIERIHLEEDTARSYHQDKSTLLDYNRAGIGLIEIVSKPSIESAKEAQEYVQMIQLIALMLNISDAKMEEGSLRADINISIKLKNQKNLGTRVEIKNLNSLHNIKKAIEYEEKLQILTLEKNQKVIQTTKRYDEKSQKTVVMRSKLDAIDYKYFPEPNILPIKLEKKWIDSLVVNQLPWDKKNHYQKLNLNPEFIDQLILDPQKSFWFDQIKFDDYDLSSKLFFSQILPLAKYHKVKLENLKITPLIFKQLLFLAKKNNLQIAKIKNYVQALNDQTLTINQVEKEILKKENLSNQTLNVIIKELVNQNLGFVKNNIDNFDKVINFLLGQIMRHTKGQANPQTSREIVKELLKDYVAKK